MLCRDLTSLYTVVTINMTPMAAHMFLMVTISAREGAAYTPS